MSCSALSLRRRRRVRQLVGQLGPQDDAAGRFLDDVARADRQVMHAAADRDRAAPGDALEPVGAAGDLELAVATKHVDALAAQLGIDPRPVLAGDRAAALTLLCAIQQVYVKDRGANHEARVEWALLRLDEHHAAERSDERGAIGAGLEDLASALPGCECLDRLIAGGRGGRGKGGGSTDRQAGPQTAGA